MKVKRGDVVLAVFPHAIGTGAKKRPVVVVQSDVYNQSMHNTLATEITSLWPVVSG
jgi:mRNA-degrading endonuclease toxin of MazEF toxin-antitoxin module